MEWVKPGLWLTGLQKRGQVEPAHSSRKPQNPRLAARCKPKNFQLDPSLVVIKGKRIHPYSIYFSYKVKSSSLPVQIFLKYLDLIQDALLLHYVAESMGGISVVFENPTLFSSVVSIYSIRYPILKFKY